MRKTRLNSKAEMRPARPLWAIQRLVDLTWSQCLEMLARKTVLMSNPVLQ